MNEFQNIGVILQLVAMVVLLLKIICTGDCTGISGKTQILFALAFTLRFSNLPYDLRVSLHSFVIKVAYLFVIYLTVVSIIIIFKRTYKREYDKLRFELPIGASTLLALLASYRHLEPLNVLWHLGLYLETFAILPQIRFTALSGYVGSSLLFYVGLLASYRAFHVVQWAYQLLDRGHLDSYHVAAAGSLQFVIYASCFTWMVPRFKAQYASLKHAESQLVVQPDVLTIVQANGTEETKRIEPLIQAD